MGTDRTPVEVQERGVPAIAAERASRYAEPARPISVKKMRRRAARLAGRSAQRRYFKGVDENAFARSGPATQE
jgi:hypothetical protein